VAVPIAAATISIPEMITLRTSREDLATLRDQARWGHREGRLLLLRIHQRRASRSGGEVHLGEASSEPFCVATPFRCESAVRYMNDPPNGYSIPLPRMAARGEKFCRMFLARRQQSGHLGCFRHVLCRAQRQPPMIIRSTPSPPHPVVRKRKRTTEPWVPPQQAVEPILEASFRSTSRPSIDRIGRISEVQCH
jgi:hypothetical protein